MLNNLVPFLFPILLIIGTLLLARREVKSYIRLKSTGTSLRWINFRIIRRGVGLLIMMAIGIMIIIGITKNPAESSAISYMKFWLTCFFLVLCVLVLALWDAVCEIRKIREYVNDFRKSEEKCLKKKYKIYHN